MRVLIFLLLAFLSAPFCAYAEILEEFMPITIDGDLNDPAWGRAPKVEPEKGVTCWTLASKGQLCVAVQSRRLDGAPPIARAVPREGQNSPAFIDDCVEIRISVCGDDASSVVRKYGDDASSVVKSFFLNARGAVWQDAEPSENARVPWKTASKIALDGTWTLEASAPLDALKITDPKKAAAPQIVRHWFQAGSTQDQFLIGFDFAYYPTANVIRAKADLSAFPGGEKVQGAEIRLLEKATGKVLAENRFDRFVNSQALLWRWDVPTLAEGEYELELVLDGVKHSRITRPFVRHHFEWEGNQLGLSDRLIPPFTTIQLKKNRVKTILRSHEFDSLGLWSQVEIKDSHGRRKELLAAPVRLEIRVDGGKAAAVGSAGLKWKPMPETGTRLDGSAKWKVEAGDPARPIHGKVRVHWDFDGLMTWKFTIEPTDRKIDALTLTIPMNDALAPLMHACTDGIRFNYAGFLPKGDGTVWKSQDAPRREIVGNFVPYLWVGAEEPGITICAENDRGWINDPEKPCQEIVRDGKTLNLVFHLIGRPSKIKSSRTITLAFQATPIKPMPAGWRRKAYGDWQAQTVVPPEDFINFWGAGYYWGTETGSGDLKPRDGNYEYLRKIAVRREGGEIDETFIKEWMKGYTKMLDSVPDPIQKEERYKMYLAHVNAGFHIRPHSAISAYTNGRGLRLDLPEGQTFLNEWTVPPYMTRLWPYGGHVDYEMETVPSFRDYAVWHYKKMLETCVDSIYWDDFFLVSNFNTYQTAAYVMTDPETDAPILAKDGLTPVVQPSVGLFNMRECVRRTATLILEMGREPMNIIHDTNTAINPILSMCQFHYTWEDHPGTKDFQDRFSRDYIRAESIGRQQGTIPFNLWLVRGGTEEEREWASRTGTGVALTHEMRNGGSDYWRTSKILRDFGYGLDSVRVENYWDEDFPVRVEGLDTSALLLTKGGERLLLVCDWGGGGDGTVSIAGFQPKTAENAETGEKLEVTADGKVKIHLKKHDYTLILMQGK